jgi:hypothetical protein
MEDGNTTNPFLDSNPEDIYTGRLFPKPQKDSNRVLSASLDAPMWANQPDE